jgi:hypothetical protein
VSDPKRIRYFVRNQQNQPVELHFSSGLVVLGPRQELEIGAPNLGEPQFKELCRRRLLTTREVAEPADEQPVTKPRQKPARSRNQEGENS